MLSLLLIKGRFSTVLDSVFRTSLSFPDSNTRHDKLTLARVYHLSRVIAPLFLIPFACFFFGAGYFVFWSRSSSLSFIRQNIFFRCLCVKGRLEIGFRQFPLSLPCSSIPFSFSPQLLHRRATADAESKIRRFHFRDLTSKISYSSGLLLAWAATTGNLYYGMCVCVVARTEIPVQSGSLFKDKKKATHVPVLSHFLNWNVVLLFPLALFTPATSSCCTS